MTDIITEFNRLLKVEVAATAVGTAMGIGAVTTGMLGMNLKTPLFDSDKFQSGWTFNLAVPVIVVLCLGVSLYTVTCHYAPLHAQMIVVLCLGVSCSMICFLYCPARRLRAFWKSVCCSWCRPSQKSFLPSLPSQDSAQRRLLSSVSALPQAACSTGCYTRDAHAMPRLRSSASSKSL